MKLIYILNFDINGRNGRNMVSKEKANTLREIMGNSNIYIWYPRQDTDSKIRKYLGYVLYDFICALKILRLPRGTAYSVIYRVIFFPLSQLAMGIRRIPAIYEVHADFPNEIKHFQKSKAEVILLKILAYFDKMNFKRSKGIIYNHPVLMEILYKKYPKPSIYTYNAVNTNNIKPLNKAAAREKLSIPEDEKIALFIGSVSKWHGVHYLVDAFNDNRLKNDDRKRLYVVGVTDTPYVTMLKERARGNDNIIFVNRVNFEDAHLYINAADICLLPVDNIRTSPGSPIKLYEYIACGKPVLCQENMLGYSDEIINYQLGTTTDFTQAEKAANDLYAMLNKNDYNFYQTNNVNKARTDLSWRKRMQQWIDFVNSFK